MSDDAAPAATIKKIRCPQCGAPLEVPRGAEHITCPYCGSVVEVRTGIYQGEFWARPVFDKTAATERFFRWTAERDKPAPFKQEVELLSITPIWVPTWHIREWRTGEGGAREIAFRIEPGFKDTASFADLSPHNLPLQAIRPVEEDLEGERAEPDMGPQEKIALFQSQGRELDQLALVYVPIYRIAYAYKGRKYSLLIEGMTGGVHAKNYPKKPGWPFYLYTVLFGIIYLGLGWVLFDYPDITCAGVLFSLPFSALIAYILVKKV